MPKMLVLLSFIPFLAFFIAPVLFFKYCAMRKLSLRFPNWIESKCSVTKLKHPGFGDRDKSVRIAYKYYFEGTCYQGTYSMPISAFNRDYASLAEGSELSLWLNPKAPNNALLDYQCKAAHLHDSSFMKRRIIISGIISLLTTGYVIYGALKLFSDLHRQSLLGLVLYFLVIIPFIWYMYFILETKCIRKIDDSNRFFGRIPY